MWDYYYMWLPVWWICLLKPNRTECWCHFSAVLFHAISLDLWPGVSQDSTPHHEADYSNWNICMDGPWGIKQFKYIATARSALDWRENWVYLWKLLQAFVQLPFSCYIHTVPDSFPCACNKVILLLTHQLSTMISYVDAKEGACLSIMWCVFLWDTALGNHNTWSTIQWCVLCIAAREGVGRKG